MQSSSLITAASTRARQRDIPRIFAHATQNAGSTFARSGPSTRRARVPLRPNLVRARPGAALFPRALLALSANPRHSGIRLALAAALVYGFLGVALEAAGTRHDPAWLFIFWKQLRGTGLIFAVGLIMRRPLDRPQALGLAAIGAVSSVLTCACYRTASHKGSVRPQFSIFVLLVVKANGRIGLGPHNSRVSLRASSPLWLQWHCSPAVFAFRRDRAGRMLSLRAPTAFCRRVTRVVERAIGLRGTLV